MNIKVLLSTTLAASIAASAAFAQDVVSPPITEIPTPTGPQIPGLCIVSIEGLVGASQLGQFIGMRIQQIAAQTNAEINEAQSAVQADQSNLQARVNAVGPEAAASDIEAYNTTVDEFLGLVELRQAEIQRTEALALQRFDREAAPVMLEVSQQQQCALVMEAGQFVVADPRADITPEVIAGLDAKITQFPIEKATVQQQQQPGQLQVPQ